MKNSKMGEFSKAERATETAKSASKLLKEWYYRPFLSKQKGRHVAWCMVGIPPEILTVFDIDALWPENYGTVCASRQMAVHFMEIAESEGYSASICSYARNTLGYAFRRQQEGGAVPPEAPLGGMKEPDMILTLGEVCDVRTKWFQALSTRYMNVPMYVMEVLNPPYGAPLEDEEFKRHYMESKLTELKGLVEFLEKTTAKKLDQERLVEAISNSFEAQRLFWEVHQLRKAVPSPMPSQDTFACIIPQMYLRGERLAKDFYLALYKEVKERVEKGLGVIPEEKFRLMWVGIPPWFNMGIFNYIQSLGAVCVMETQYYVGSPIDIDPQKGLEALAERSWQRTLEIHRYGAEIAPEATDLTGGPAIVPAAQVEEWVREYRIDGVIMHVTKSCRSISFGQLHYRNVLQKALDVPILFIESDMADPRAWADASIKTRISAFIEMIDARKKG